MEKFKVVQAPISIIEYARKDKNTGQPTGEKGQITQFAALRVADGSFMPVCQIFGDHKAKLEEALKDGKELEGEINFNSERNRFDIKLPAGSDAARRGGKTWVPQGYRGKPMPFELWWETTDRCMKHAVEAIVRSVSEEKLKDASVENIISEARSLVAQYWMSIERNVTFIPGYEPAAAASQEAVSSAPTTGQTPTPPPQTPTKSPVEVALLHAIEAAETSSALDGFSTTINQTESLTGQQKADLHLAVFNRRRALSQLQGG